MAVLLAMFCIGFGMIPIMSGFGLSSYKLMLDTPGWIEVAAGLVFVLFGVAAILPSVVAGRYRTDGLFWIARSRYCHVVYVVLGPCVLALMTTIAAWVAFGPGIRHFSRTTDQNAGRSGFAVAAVFFAVLGIRWTIVGVRWLRQPDNDRPSDLF
jgi:hypothetical protein